MTSHSVRADARSRAVRTLVQGLLVDVLVAIGAGAAAIQGGATVQQAATLVAAALTKTLMQAGASWAGRYVAPPANSAAPGAHAVDQVAGPWPDGPAD